MNKSSFTGLRTGAKGRVFSFGIMALLFSLLSFRAAAADKEAYAFLSEDSNTLTFYFDDQKSSHTFGLAYDLNTGYNDPAWLSVIQYVMTVVFDNTFANYYPTTCNNWFCNFSNLTTIEHIENLNTSNVTNMCCMFYGCGRLRTLDLSHFNTANVTDMGGMFLSCGVLTTLDLSKFNTPNVTNMQEMFDGCANLETIFVSDEWETTLVTSSAGMFDRCPKLKGGKGTEYNGVNIDKTYARIDDPDNSAPGYLTYKGPYAFLSDDAKTLTFYFDDQKDSRTGGTACDLNTDSNTPAWATAASTIETVVFDNTFANCYPTTCANWFGFFSNLTTIENIENLNTSNVTNMSGMFSGCKKLATLDLSHFNTAEVTDMNHMFNSCGNLETLDLSMFNTAAVTDMSAMFCFCEKLTTLDLSRFNTAEVTETRTMFYCCKNLETILVSDEWNTTSVASSINMFSGCTKLKGGKGTEYDDANPKDITYACIDDPDNSAPGYLTYYLSPYAFLSSDAKTLTFYFDDQKDSRTGGTACDLNTDSNTPAWATAASTIETVVFDNTFANYHPTTCYYWFNAFNNLTTIENIKNLNTSNVTNMSGMFNGCENLTTLDLSHFNTAEVTDMASMFDGCANLETIFASDEWETTLVTPSAGMFDGCTKLKGGKGTEYDDANPKNKIYARIDDPDNSAPGYLTHKGPYAFLSSDGKTLTFYFDDQKSSRTGGTAINLNTGSNNPAWRTAASTIETVAFDNTFANYYPTTCYMWFWDFNNLTTIENIENLNTSSVTNMRYMFGLCTNLATLDLSHFNTANVTDMSHMFDDCDNLKTLDLSHFNTANVTDMSCMFNSCGNLKTLDLSHFNTANVTNMRFMFQSCENLTTLDLSHFNTAKVTKMDYMFSECTNLETLDLSHFNTANVKDMRHMFENCSNLETLDLSHFNTAEVTDMSSMFYHCENLATLDLSTFNTANVTDMDCMFYDCENLETILVSNEWSTTSVTEADEMFDGCTKLKGGKGTEYDGANEDKTYARIDDPDHGAPGYLTHKGPYAFLSSDGKTLTFYFDDQKSSRTGGTAINLNTGSNNPAWRTAASTIETVAFDNTFANYYPTTCYMWFWDFNNLTTIENIENLNTSSVTNMRYMFGLCTNLATLDLSHFNTANVTDMKGMFNSCTNLETLDLSHFNTANVTDMEGMFNSCWNLKTLDLSHFNTAKVTDMEGMFNSCENLKTLDLSHFNTANVTDMSGMFNSCKNLKTLDLSKFNTAKVTKMNAMFYDCGNLKTILVSDEWSSTLVTSSNFMFKNCSNLKGGYGTGYNSSYTDKTYARIDDPDNSAPGYLTYYIRPYAFLSDDEKTLTFYFDDQKDSRTGGTACDLNTDSNTPAWATAASTIETVVFDNTFANCYPTTCAGWFGNFSNLTTIENIENLNTSNVTNMGAMFMYCGNLTTLDLSHFNTAKVTDMTCMFMCCTNLATLDLSHFNTAEVTSMFAMFDECENLTSLDLSHFNTAKVTDMLGMFCECKNLTTLDLSHFNTAEVTRMYCMFYDCENLTSLDLSHFNTAKVTDMRYMFCECKNLTSLDLSKFNTAEVTDMRHMFEKCSNLATLDLSHFNTANVTVMDSMFYDCENLETILVTNEWSTTYVTSSNNMFQSCPKLKGGKGTEYNSSYTNKTYAHIDGGNSNPGYLTEQAYVELSADKKTLTFYFDSDKASKTGETYYIGYDNSTNLINWRGKCGGVETVVFDASFDNYRPTTCEQWFDGFSSLQSFTHLEYLRTDNVKSMWSMFSYCTSLVSLTLPATFMTHNVEYMIWMFGGCNNLETLILPNTFQTDNVTSMASMFYDCSKLSAVNLSQFNTAKVKSMEQMFKGCEGFSTLDFTQYTNFTTANVTDMLNMFRDCSNLETLNISTFKTDSVTDMSGMFSGCRKLKELDLSHFNTAKVTDMSGMFGFCDSLRTLDIRTFKTDSVTDMRYMFWNNPKLSTIMVSDTNWSKANVQRSNQMFSECNNLIGNFGATPPQGTLGTDSTQANWGENGYLTIDKYKIFYNGIDDDNNTFDTYTGAVTEFIDEEVTLTIPTKRGYAFDGWTRVYPDGTEEAKVASVSLSATDKGNRIYKANWKVKEVYVNRSEDGKTLTFYYDADKSTRSGTTYDFTYRFVSGGAGYYIPKWAYSTSDRQKVENVVFDSSFDEYRPTTCDRWFYGHTSLSEIEGWEYLHTDDVESMRYMFYNCNNLQSIDLSHFNTAMVTDMGHMFDGCKTIQSLTFPNTFSTAIVTDMGYMFMDCQKLGELDLSGFNTTSVTDMDRMFENCYKLANLNISNFNTAEVESMYEMFKSCYILGTIALPSTFTTDKVKSMGGMFDACEAVDSLDLRNFNTSLVTDMKSMFDNCWVLDTLLVDKNKFKTDNVKYFQNMFSGCYKLATIDIDFVAPLAEGKMDDMFNGCKLLTELDLSQFNTGNITSMERVFAGCNKLKGLDLSNFNTANVTSMYGMFNGCYNLEWLDLRGFTTPLVTDVAWMFKDCLRLTTILVSADWDLSQITALANYTEMFYDCREIIGNLGTRYNSTQIGKLYARIDSKESNGTPIHGYFTEGSYKILYDLNGGDEPATPNPDQFDLNLTSDITLNEPTKEGYMFKGWTGGPCSGISADVPQRDVTIAAGSRGNREYTANWAAIHTISFNSNGVNDVLPPIVDTVGADISAIVNPIIDGTTVPTRTGYNFTGWSGEIPTTIPDYDVTLTAQWTPAIYTITIDYAGGELPEGETNLETYTVETEDFTLVNPTKTGSTFNGWNTGNDIVETVTIEKGSTGNLSYTAEWTLNQHTITFVTNGGTAIPAITQNYGTSVTAPQNPKREGYKFKSWDKTIPATMPDEDMTITAQWRVNQYTISFNDEDGTELASVTADYGELIYAPKAPVKTGYDFVKWNANFPMPMPAEDLTISPVWKVRSHTVTFNTDGGSEVAAVTKNYGEAIDNPANPTKEHYEFKGWDMTIPATMPDEDLTITALWQVNQYTITFADEDGQVLATVTVDYGKQIEAPDAPAKTGYDFVKWDADFPMPMPDNNPTVNAVWKLHQSTIKFIESDSTVIATITQDYGTDITAPEPEKTGYSLNWDKEVPATMPAEDLTITAQWKINSYTITFATNGGSAVESITDDFGTAIVAPANPTRKGYVFKGWNPEIPATMPAEDLTITAQWKKNSYTIAFDANGGSPVDEITESVGAEIDVPANPTRKGYTFKGWNPEIPATMPAEDLTITAQWEINSYTIVFDTDGGTAIASITQPYGSEVVAPQKPEKTGYDFKGWDKEIPAVMPDSNLTIKAVWVAIHVTIDKRIKLTADSFDADGYLVADASNKNFCVGKAVFSFAVEAGVPENYSIEFAGNQIAAQTGSVIENSVTIELPKTLAAGVYNGFMELTNQDGWASDQIPVKLVIRLPRQTIYTIYNNLAAVNALAGEFTAYQWTENGTAIAGETDKFLKRSFSTSSVYTAIVTLNDGSTAETCPLDLSRVNSKSVSVNVYPNPATSDNDINIEVSDNYEPSADNVIFIYNIDGALVKTMNNPEQKSKMQLPQGSYSGVYMQNGQKAVFKVIVR